MVLQVAPEFMLANIKCCPDKNISDLNTKLWQNKPQHAFSRRWGRKGDNCTFVDADNVARLQDWVVPRCVSISHGYLTYGWMRLLSVQLSPSSQ